MNVMATAAILFSHFTFSLAEEVGANFRFYPAPADCLRRCCLHSIHAGCMLCFIVDCALAVCLACTYNFPALLLVDCI